MNLNIVKYILETTEMNQTDIANKLKAKKKKGIDKEVKVSQASISQWSRGSIPDDRAIELLKIAGLYWELEDYIDYDNYEDPDFPPDGDSSIPLPDFLRDKSVESKWNVLVKTEKNQNDWYQFISDMLSPKQYKNIKSEFNDNDFVKFARECLFLLNLAGFVVPESPPSNKSTDSVLFNLFRKWMNRITILQYWCASTLPQDKHNFPTLYGNLSEIALAQCIVGSNRQVPEKTDPLALKNFVEGVNRISKTSIDNYYAWQGFHMESYFDDDSFNEILIYSNDDKNDNISQSSSTTSSDEIQQNDDKYLSYAERKIMDRLNANEKLIQELHQKIDLLINQNDDSDGIPF